MSSATMIWFSCFLLEFPCEQSTMIFWTRPALASLAETSSTYWAA